MDIFVLLKQTFDTEEKIVLQAGSVQEDGAKFVINPYDEYAVEQAIQLRDEFGGKVTLLSVGPDRTAEALRTALAMGADEAVLITDERIQGDEYEVAEILAQYLRSQSFDLLLGGNFSVDNGAGQVAIRLAALLEIPHAASITKLEISGAVAVAHRDAEGDIEVIEVPLPALFTAQQGLNEPRYPSLPGIMKAKKKPFQHLTLDDIEGADSASAKTTRLELKLPPERQAGRILKGEIAQQVTELVQALRNESKVI
ncbi:MULTISPECIES: electron transfer flavoprotein subunit beta/FixA family protein [Paenibacillus]|uniref:Electron transfer flavoprotein subunit beta n=1 Tax=Paenibacillus violae TaxID=3077234 RepID=A0ABU3R7Q0_9BACL|nr:MULTISPECIES: electron transfer flavoprotein subunit beta/FixA family protein [Paenibacillus]MDU0200272.1 electron transfer flavoprotein subunit beta/FixA family protein [Paenibacillus sp. PFR10]MEC0265931.1 electron transfer flavoprotein subunit beta/FixA family protein [Paenibacillus anseongense]